MILLIYLLKNYVLFKNRIKLNEYFMKLVILLYLFKNQNKYRVTVCTIIRLPINSLSQPG